MTSTATQRLRLERQGTGDNPNDWGNRANNVFDLIDEAVGGYAAVTVAANVTLTTANYLSDQARRAVLRFTGAGGFTVTFPAVEKLYYIDNRCVADVLVKTPAGTNATVLAGSRRMVYCDGTNMITDTTVLNSATTTAFNPAGNLVATTVQDALVELDTEKVAKAGDTMTGSLTAPTFQCDANARFYLSGTNVFSQFDAGDYISFDRTNNILNVFNGNTSRIQILSDGIVNCVTGLSTQGRAVYGGNIFTASSGSAPDIGLAETTLLDLSFGSTGGSFFGLATCTLWNQGTTANIQYGVTLYNAAATAIYSVTRQLTAVGGLGGTATLAMPIACAIPYNALYTARISAWKTADNGGRVLVNGFVRWDAINC